MSRVGYLGDQKWACSVADVRAEADEEAASQVHWLGIVRRRERLEKGSKEHEKVANHYSSSVKDNL